MRAKVLPMGDRPDRVRIPHQHGMNFGPGVCRFETLARVGRTQIALAGRYRQDCKLLTLKFQLTLECQTRSVAAQLFANLARHGVRIIKGPGNSSASSAQDNTPRLIILRSGGAQKAFVARAMDALERLGQAPSDVDANAAMDVGFQLEAEAIELGLRVIAATARASALRRPNFTSGTMPRSFRGRSSQTSTCFQSCSCGFI